MNANINMKQGLTNNFHIKEDLPNILLSDFWILENVDANVFNDAHHPLKFSASSSILVKKGTGIAEIDLLKFDVVAPCVVNIRRDQILQINEMSEDFEASCIIMSPRFTDNILLLIGDSRFYMTAARRQITQLPPELLPLFEQHYQAMKEILCDTGNPYSYQAQVLGICYFFLRIASKVYGEIHELNSKFGNRIPEMFVNLVQKHFREERFLEFYANLLDITPKHLSRTMKSQTGFSAVEWIERYVVLEAKVLLKSSTMTVQQIADELNFPSQSFFGKYFKKKVGMSPKDFRNS